MRSPTSRPSWETIPPFLDRASPLRTSHLRDPVGPADPLRQRILHGRGGGMRSASIRSSCGLRHVKDPRDIAVIKAAAEKAGWKPRPSPRKGQSGNTVSGRGIAYATPQRHAGRRSSPRSTSTARPARSGRGKFTVAHDCGQIINPIGLSTPSRATSSRAQPHALGRGASSTTRAVTSIDWHDLPDPRHHRDAGDASTACCSTIRTCRRPAPARRSIRPVAAAIANAVFDATGVRIRRAPFTPDRVRAAMS